MREPIEVTYKNYDAMQAEDFIEVYGQFMYNRISKLIKYFTMKDQGLNITWHKIGTIVEADNKTVQKHYGGYKAIKG